MSNQAQLDPLVEAQRKIEALERQVRELTNQLKEAEKQMTCDRVRIDTLRWCIEVSNGQ